MRPAVFDVTQVDVESGAYTLRASGRILREPGFLAVYRENRWRRALEAQRRRVRGDAAGSRRGRDPGASKISSEQKFTQPPAGFSEGDVVKALEENGIGRLLTTRRPAPFLTLHLTLMTSPRSRRASLGAWQAGQHHAAAGLPRHPERGLHGG